MIALAIQRCACGGGHDGGGECPACRARRLQRASALVGQTLARPGRPLEPAVRSDLERALGHDFGAVRVHADQTAAASAAAVSAHAYTVGSDVVFGAGRYRPSSTDGRRLLAHELTHVRQQAGAPASGPVRIVDDPAAEAEAERAAAGPVRPLRRSLQRQDDGSEPEAAEPQPVVEAPPVIEPTEGAPAEAVPATEGTGTPAAVACQALTWAAFRGRVPRGTTFAAETRFSIPDSNGRFTAVFNGRTSWVQPKYPGSGARATNGCASVVRDCRRFFAGLGSGQTGTWDYGTGQGCPATIATPAQATNSGECETVVGTQCDTDAPSESARLLNHEQRHLDIACKLADKANTALANGSALADVRSAVHREQGAQTTAYDRDTNHGCDAGQQATWDADIDAGLPSVTIP